ncbi:MAG: polysaccharide biosynthesis tyrosine autokinase [Acidimicrobiales bacterium]
MTSASSPPPTAPPPAETASLGQYLHLLWRRKLTILLPVVVAAGVAYAFAERQERAYESFTDIIFGASGTDAAPARAVSIPTEARVATSPAVLAAAASRLAESGVPVGPLAVEAEQAGEIAVLRLRARHPSPTVAADIVDAVSNAYLAERGRRAQQRLGADTAEISTRLTELSTEIDRLAREIAAHEVAGEVEQAAVARQQMNVLAGEQAVQQARLYQVRLAAAGSDRDISVLVPPTVPAEPLSPQPRRSALIGGLIGLLAGLGAALARERLGSAVRQVGDVEAALGVPVLAVVPRVGRRHLKKTPVAMLDGADSDGAEAYRILRTNLTAAGAGDDLRVVVVTSAVTEEGKSTTAANLAASFAEAGVETLLIDGDLRRPRLHRLFDRPNDRGLSTLLDARVEPAEVSALASEVRVAAHLSVLPAGPPPGRPGQLVVSPQLPRVMAAIRTSYLVVIDAPPVLPVADVGALTAVADAVVVVVRPELVRQATLAQLRIRLDQLDARVLGAVVNAPRRSSFETPPGYGYGYYGADADRAAPSSNGSGGRLSKLRRSGR